MPRISSFAFLFCSLCIVASAWGQRPGFPEPTPVRDANPAVRAPLAVEVPTRLKVARVRDVMVVRIDTSDKTLADAKIDVGSKMITGVQCEWFVYPKGPPRPRDFTGLSLTSGADFKPLVGYEDILRSKDRGFPKPGVTYVVEMELTIFETDVPAQHEWSPTDTKKYKVLWTRTLKQIVPP